MLMNTVPTPVVCPKNLMTPPRVAAADALIAPQTAVLRSVMDGLSVATPTATVADIFGSVDVAAFSSAIATANAGAVAVAPEYQRFSQAVTQAGDAVTALLTAAKTNTSPAELAVGPLLNELGSQFEVMVQGSWIVDPSRSPKH